MSTVLSLSKSATHSFSKITGDKLQLIAGQGVDGDAHCGETVKHLSRVKVDPTQPNLRQVHLIHHELILTLQQQGFAVKAGTMGENITTKGIDLLSLPRGALLRIGSAVVEITGLRNPCKQLNDYQSGLMSALLDRDEHPHLIRKAGVMGIVLKSGEIVVGDVIDVDLPKLPFQRLEKV